MRKIKEYLVPAVLLLGLAVIFAAAAFGPVNAGLIYDLVGGNALVRGQLDVKGSIDTPGITTGAVLVNSYDQLETYAGVSIYRADSKLGTRINVDPVAINASALPYTSTGMTGWTLSGVTIVPEPVTEDNDRVEWEVMCINATVAGVSPIIVSAPQNTGVTTSFAAYQNMRVTGASGEWITGTSIWTIDNAGDRKKFRNSHGTGVSIFEIESQIGS